MSPLDVAVYIVRVFVGDAEVIVDVSFVVRASPSTASESSDRISIVKSPTDTVDVVASLLDDSVAGEPFAREFSQETNKAIAKDGKE